MSEYLLGLYNQAPNVFSDDEVDQLEEFAKSNDLPFSRDPNSTDFSLGRTLNQIGSGFVSGLTTMKTGEAPRNDVERIANSIGHLAGFIGFIPGVGTGVSALAKTGGTASKVIKGLGVTARPGKLPIGGVATGISLPMLGTNLIFSAVKQGAKISPKMQAAKFLQDTSKFGNYVQQGLHLGTASAISSIQDGWKEMLNSFASGTVAGGVFAGIPDFKTLNRLVKSPDPVRQQQGLNGVRALAGALSNVGLTAGTGAIRGQEIPSSEYIYQFILGGYFGYKTRPFEETLGAKRVQEAIERKETSTKNEKFEYLTKDDIRDYDILPTDTKTFIDKQLSLDPQSRQLIAQTAPEEAFELGQEFSQARYNNRDVIVDIRSGINKKNQVRIYEMTDPAQTEYTSKLVSIKKVELPEQITVKKAKEQNIKEVDDSSTEYILNELHSNRLNKILDTIEADGYSRIDATTNLAKISKSFNRGIDQPSQMESFKKLFPISYNKIENDLAHYIKYNEGLREVPQLAYVEGVGVKPRGSISINNDFVAKMKHDSLLDTSIKSLSKNLEWLKDKPKETFGIRELEYIHTKTTKTVKRDKDAQSLDEINRYTESNILDENVFIDSKTGNFTDNGNKVLLDLAVNQQSYVLSSKKNKGTLQVSPFLFSNADAPQVASNYVRAIGKNTGNGSTVKAIQNYNKLKKAFVKNITQTVYGKEKIQLNETQAGVLYDRIFASNVRLIERMNGDLPIAEIYKADKGAKKGMERFIKDPIDFNNRMQLFDAAEPGLSPTRFINNKGNVTLEDAVINKDTGKVELNFSLINSKNQSILDRDGISKIIAEVDGAVFLRHDLFDAMLRDGGFPKDATVLKGTVSSVETGKGLLSAKLAYFRAPNILNRSLKIKKLHGEIYDTSIKQLGLRELTQTRYIPSKNKAVDNFLYTNKKAITKVSPEDIRLNLGVYENIQKSLMPQKLAKQIISTLTSQQISRGAQKELLEYISREAIDGDPVVGQKIADHISGKKILSDKEISKIDIDSIPIEVVTDFLQRPESSKLYQHLAKKMMSPDNDMIKSDVQTKDSIQQIKEGRRFNSSADRILKVADLDPAIINHKWVNRYADNIITTYIRNRITSPKLKYSGKAIGLPNNLAYKAIYKTQEGQFRLAKDWERFIVKVGENEMTLGAAWKELNSKPSKERKALLEDAMNFVIARVPIDSVSGIRVLKFKGFLEDRGAGIIINGRDMTKMSGMDVDIDSVFLYQNMPKKFRKELSKASVKDEHYKDTGKGQVYIDAKSPQSEKLLTSNRWGKQKIDKIRENPFAMFDPVARINAGNSLYLADKNVGASVNSLKRAKLVYEYEAANKSTDIIQDKGKGVREFGRSAIQIAVDAKNYARIKRPEFVNEQITKRIYKDENVSYGDLWGKPETAAILNVERALTGRKYDFRTQKSKKLRLDEIITEIQRPDNQLPEGSSTWLNFYADKFKTIDYNFEFASNVNTRNLTKQTEKIINEIAKLPQEFDSIIFKNVKDFKMSDKLNSYDQRNIISNGISQLVSISRLTNAIQKARAKGLSNQEIFDAFNFADNVNYASYFATKRNALNKLTPEAIDYINSTNLKTPSDVNVLLKQKLDSSKPEVKNLILEKLISNITGPTPQEINLSYNRGTGIPKELPAAIKAEQQNQKYTADLQRFGFVAELMPDATIRSWFKDYSNVYQAIQIKPTAGYAKQLIAGNTSKIESVRRQASHQEKVNITMNLLKKMPLKNPPQEILKAKQELETIFSHHRDGFTKEFEKKFLGIASDSPYGATKKVPRTLEAFNAQTLSDFLGYWRTVSNGKLTEIVAKEGMPLKWKDFFKFPSTIAEKHLQYDLQWAKKETMPVKVSGKQKEAKYDLLVPISSKGKLLETTQKSLEFYDGRADVNNSKIIDRYKFEANIPKDIRSDVIDDAVALIEIKGSGAQIYKDAHAKALENFKKYKNRKDVINIDGKNVKLSYQKLVETVSKKYEQDLTNIQKDIFGRTFGSKKEFDDARINIMDETNPNHAFWDFVVLKKPENGKKISNINIDATISKRISSPLFTKKLGTSITTEPFLHYARLSDIIVKMESFTSKNSNKLVKDLNPNAMDNWFKKWEKRNKFKGVGFTEGYFPHIGHLRSEVEAYMQRKLKLKEDANVESIKHYVDNANSPDGGMSDPVSRLVMNPTERARKTKENDMLHGTLGMRTRPQNLLSRDINDPTPGYRKGADVISTYQNKILKATTNHLIGLSAYKTIKDFSKLKPFGKDTVQWERFFKLYTADNLGYPSVMPQRWADDPNFAGNKKSFYYKFTDKYIFDKMNKHSKTSMAGKSWYDSPEDLSRKLNHFSILEGKYQLWSLLFNTRTFVNNMAGGNTNNIISAGWDNFYFTYDKLDKIVPRMKGDPVRRGYDWFKKKAEEYGAVETYLTGEFKSNPIFGKGKTGIDFQKEIQKLKDNNQLTRKNIGEIANRLGVSGRAERIAGSLMRISEERLRTRSFWMHYKKALEVYGSNGVVFKANDPILVDFALRGSQNAQFLYNNAQRPAFSRTSMGRVFSRFQVFMWNSIKLRKNTYKAAKGYGFDPNTPEFDQFKRMLMADMFMLALASYYPASLFENTVPAPYNVLQDLAGVAFGDERERERAFFGTLPAPFNVIQAVSPPSARVIFQPLGSALKGDWDRFFDYQIYNMFPTGLMIKTGLDIAKSPLSLVNKTTGFPLYQMAAKVRDKRKLTEEEKKKGEQE